MSIERTGILAKFSRERRARSGAYRIARLFLPASAAPSIRLPAQGAARARRRLARLMAPPRLSS